MHILMLDTCVWLEVASKKNEMRTLAAIEYLVEQGVVAVLLPALVQEEFERNKDRVADQTRKRLSQECKLVKEVLASFGGEGTACGSLHRLRWSERSSVWRVLLNPERFCAKGPTQSRADPSV